MRAATRLAEALLGPDVDAALVFEDQNLTGARCQAEVAEALAVPPRGASGSAAREGKKGHLRGTLRAEGGHRPRSWRTACSRTSGTTRRAVSRRGSTASSAASALNCGGQSLPALFPGECAVGGDERPGARGLHPRSAPLPLLPVVRGVRRAHDRLRRASTTAPPNVSCPTDAELVCSVPGHRRQLGGDGSRLPAPPGLPPLHRPERPDRRRGRRHPLRPHHAALLRLRAEVPLRLPARRAPTRPTTPTTRSTSRSARSSRRRSASRTISGTSRSASASSRRGS